MTVEMLLEALGKIPAKGAVNLARRRAIIAQIMRLMEEGGA
jgi:hypothetical protein